MWCQILYTRLRTFGVKRENWRSAGPIREIFREAFAGAGLQYFNPHSLRKTLARLGGSLCHTAEEYKAWSQNLGHEGVLTTFLSYGEVESRRQGEIIRSLTNSQSSRLPDADQIARTILRMTRREGAVE